MQSGTLTTGIALEADSVLGGSHFASLQFSGGTKSERTRVALEGIVSTVWDTIRKLIRKSVEMIKRFIGWLRGDGKQFDEAHLSAVEEQGRKLADGIERLAQILQTEHLRQRYEENLYSKLMADSPAQTRAILDANSEYSKAMVSLSQSFDKGDYTEIIEKGVASLVAWYEKESKRAEAMDASGQAMHQDLEGFARELDTQLSTQEDGSGTMSSLTARNALELTKGRYDAIKQAKTSVNTGQYASIPKDISALKSTVVSAQTLIGVAGAARSMRQAQQALEQMTEHLNTVSMKIDRLTSETEQGKVLVAQQAVARAFVKHLRELMDSFHVVIVAHEFLYGVWIETQKSMLKIWQEMVKLYDATVVDEPMSDAQRKDRAETEKQVRTALKEYAGLL
ncbi:hypothetical protein AWB81_01774 [Caballeronia arationis]|uniref:hypothetical protein n=1 Tax=Caballeronia arationis TaxID=1777142 RepID=UPI00074C7797|nr:hypothetical protein [Caballeronia arationis]SAK58972.1 hypothetical protein AWB81_01774 [Caballeronia arationis]